MDRLRLGNVEYGLLGHGLKHTVSAAVKSRDKSKKRIFDGEENFGLGDEKIGPVHSSVQKPKNKKEEYFNKKDYSNEYDGGGDSESTPAESERTVVTSEDDNSNSGSIVIIIIQLMEMEK